MFTFLFFFFGTASLVNLPLEAGWAGGGERSVLGSDVRGDGGCIVPASAVCFLSVLPHPGHCMNKKQGLEVICDICYSIKLNLQPSESLIKKS
jgi:hypothetical protein